MKLSYDYKTFANASYRGQLQCKKPILGFDYGGGIKNSEKCFSSSLKP
jgi:hypothetical protein